MKCKDRSRRRNVQGNDAAAAGGGGGGGGGRGGGGGVRGDHKSGRGMCHLVGQARPMGKARLAGDFWRACSEWWWPMAWAVCAGW
jgi:hypothetical protein